MNTNSDIAITKERLGLALGPVLALSLLAFADLAPANPLVSRTAAVAVLMAVWWVTEAIPIPATALLPVVLFPMLGIMEGKSVAGTYFNHVILLFIGGFIMALAMEKWHLHRRIALRIILLIGTGPRRIVLGFMTATAFLSMWISNTAATMMMVPIAMAVIMKIRESADTTAGHRFAVGLLIGIAYSASIGGLATLIGTPPNLAFSKIFGTSFPAAPDISFAGWMFFGVPCSLLLLIVAWVLLCFMFVSGKTVATGDITVFRDEYRRLKQMSYEEKAVLVLFVTLALAWLFRQDITLGGFAVPGWSRLMPVAEYIDDGTVAIAVALLLFLIPARTEKGARLMDWQTATRLHWGIVILFGGGFALAAGFKASGLSLWIAEQLTVLSGAPSVLMVASVSTLLTFLTELTSNTATTQIVLPLLASMGTAIQVNPLLLMIPATLSASCAFMLPVATPPNAIVFGTGEVRMGDMIRVGLIMNLLGVVIITALMFLIGLAVFGIDPSIMPDWAVN
ncbi:MAG: SLC13 family permease [candidate division Zixibacteria bacterium]|nr:SLC13 family permease [candidate division Zixibacteria bacterium]